MMGSRTLLLCSVGMPSLLLLHLVMRLPLDKSLHVLVVIAHMLDLLWWGTVAGMGFSAQAEVFLCLCLPMKILRLLLVLLAASIGKPTEHFLVRCPIVRLKCGVPFRILAAWLAGRLTVRSNCRPRTFRSFLNYSKFRHANVFRMFIPPMRP